MPRPVQSLVQFSIHHRISSWSLCPSVTLQKRVILTRTGQVRFASSFFTSSPRPIINPHHNSPRLPDLRAYHRQHPLAELLQRSHYHHASPFTRRLIIWGFIGLNVFVWAAWHTSVSMERIGHKQYRVPSSNHKSSILGDLDANFLLSRRNIAEGRWWTLWTHAVSHQSLEHLLFSMITYNAFMGAALSLGQPPLQVLGVAFFSALSGAAFQLADWERKGVSAHAAALGASGLVSGLAAYVTVLAPRLPFVILPIPVPLPLFVITGLMVAYDYHMAESPNTRVGHASHLGGTAFGLMAGLLRRLIVRF